MSMRRVPTLLQMVPRQWFVQRRHLSYSHMADLLLDEYEIVVSGQDVMRAFKAYGISKPPASTIGRRPPKVQRGSFNRNLAAIRADFVRVRCDTYNRILFQ